MNNPIIIAIIATIVTVIAFRQAGRISNRIYRGLAQLGSVLAAFAVAIMMTDSPEVGAEVGHEGRKAPAEAASEEGFLGHGNLRLRGTSVRPRARDTDRVSRARRTTRADP